MSLSPSITNVKTAGIAEWQMGNSSQAELYTPIPYLRNGKVELKPLEVKNVKGMNIQHAYELTMSAEFLATGTTSLIKKLDTMGAMQVDYIITLTNRQVIDTKSPGGTPPSPTGLGLEWELVSDKDFDDVMFIRIIANRKITSEEFTSIFVSTNSEDLGDGVGNTPFYGMDSIPRTDIIPAGITKFECSSDTSYADDVNYLRNGKFNAKLLTTKDSRGQSFGYAVDLSYEFECLEGTEVEMLKWDAIVKRLNNIKITFPTGITFTGASMTNPSMSYMCDKDMDDVAFVKVTGSGRILLSQWDGAWS
jgi:hypothetical protein